MSLLLLLRLNNLLASNVIFALLSRIFLLGLLLILCELALINIFFASCICPVIFVILIRYLLLFVFFFDLISLFLASCIYPIIVTSLSRFLFFFFFVFLLTFMLHLLPIFFYFYGLSSGFFWNLQVPVTLLQIVFKEAIVVTAIRTALVNDDSLEVVVDKIRVSELALAFLAIAHILTHIDLKRKLESIVDLEALPGHLFILCARQAQLEDRRASGQLLAFSHCYILVTRIANNIPQYLLISEIHID